MTPFIWLMNATGEEGISPTTAAQTNILGYSTSVLPQQCEAMSKCTTSHPPHVHAAHAHLVDVSQWLVPLLDQFGGKLCPFLWVHSHHSPQEQDEVWAVVDSLGVEHYLVKLAGLRKALDYLQTAREDTTTPHKIGAGALYHKTAMPHAREACMQGNTLNVNRDY